MIKLFERARALVMLPELLQHARQGIVSDVGLRIDEVARRWFHDAPGPMVHAFVLGQLESGAWDAYAAAMRVDGFAAHLEPQIYRPLSSARVVVCCDLECLRVVSIASAGEVRSMGVPFADVGNVYPSQRVTITVERPR